jgi:hypothetical protein
MLASQKGRQLFVAVDMAPLWKFLGTPLIQSICNRSDIGHIQNGQNQPSRFRRQTWWGRSSPRESEKEVTPNCETGFQFAP